MDVFLESERLLLRPFTDAEVDNPVEMHSHPEVMFFINGGRPAPRGIPGDEYGDVECALTRADWERRQRPEPYSTVQDRG